jgi:hypothetical protein
MARNHQVCSFTILEENFASKKPLAYPWLVALDANNLRRVACLP